MKKISVILPVYNEEDNLIEKIKRDECFCAWECAMNTNILFNPKFYPPLLKKTVFRKPQR